MSVGRVVGPYELVALLGQGAMGAVYRARHREVGVERALKLLLVGDGSTSRQERFEREGRNLARVVHENVVRIHEAGQHVGQPYLVMDLVQGEPLDALLGRGRLPLAEALDLAAGLARGLAALHAAGVVHRDLKPANVLVTTDRRPVIVDFGLALAPERDDRLTRTGVMVGTPMYMAPEQLSGAAVSAAVDVHSLGSIVFELTTGAHPLGDTRSFHELLSRLARDERPAPGELDPELPSALDDLCAGLLARAPEGRPPAAEAAQALERLAADVRSGAARSARAARRRRRAALSLVGLSLLGALGALGALAVAAPGPPTAPGELGPRGGTSPTTPTPPDRPPAALVEAGRRAVANLELLSSAPDRLAAAEAWLRRWPGHPDRDQVEAIARRARALRPLVRNADDPKTTQVRFLDDRRVVAVGPDRLRALDAADGRELARSPQGAEAVVVLRSGDVLAVGGRVLARFGGDDLQPRGLWALEARATTSIAATPDGALAVIGAEGAAWLVDLPAGKRQKELPHASRVWSVAVAPDGRHVVTGSGTSLPDVGVEDARLRVWTRAGALAREDDLGARVTALALAPSGDACFVGTSRGELLRFALTADPSLTELLGATTDAAADDLSRPSAHAGGIVSGLATSRTGRLWSVSYGGARELRAWDAREGRERYRVLDLPAGLCSVDVSPDGNRLVTCDARGVVEVWSTD